MSRTSLFFAVIAAVLLAGFAWLEFHQPASSPAGQEPSAQEILDQLRQQQAADREVEVVVSGSDGPGGPSVSDGSVAKLETLIISSKNPKEHPPQQAEPPQQDDLDDDEKFDRLLDHVQSPEGFSKRFEVDTIKTLRERGYNPDGTPIELGEDSP